MSLIFLELTFTGPFTSAVSSYMKLKNPSDKKVPALLVFNLCWSHLTPGVLQDQDNSSQAVLRKAQLWSGGPQQRGPDRSQSPALWVSLGSSWVGQSLFCVAQVWPQWEEQAQVYGAVNVCTRWRDQPRHPGQLISRRNNFVTKKNYFSGRRLTKTT